MGNEANVISDFIRQVKLGQENALEVASLAIPKEEGGGEKVVVALQNRVLQPEPPEEAKKARSARRAHVFHDVAGFGQYLGKYGGSNTVILADIAHERARAVLDEKSPDGFEVVALQPVLHPLMRPWARMIGKRIPVEIFAEFVMANRRVVVEPLGKELALLFSQVTAASKITASRGRGAKSVNGIMIETTIQGVTKDEPVDLPETIRLRAPLYISMDEQDIDVDVLVTAGGQEHSEVLVTLSSSGLLQARVAAFEAMVADLRNLPNCVVALGAADHAEWSCLGKAPVPVIAPADDADNEEEKDKN